MSVASLFADRAGTPLELADAFPTQGKKVGTTLAKLIPREVVSSVLHYCRNVLGLLPPFSLLPFKSLLVILVFPCCWMETRLEVASWEGVRNVQHKTFSSKKCSHLLMWRESHQLPFMPPRCQAVLSTLPLNMCPEHKKGIAALFASYLFNHAEIR